jgi:thiol:disulfide interchange protein DsbD
MTFIYAILGVVAGLTGQIFGSLTQTPGWYMGLGIIMTLAGLMMMDVIPFDPQALIERLSRRNSGGKSKVREGGTLLGAFSLGASSGFIAAPCTTPVMTSILAYIAKTQSVGFGLLLMTAFALGLGTLLLVVATFAGSLQMMPKSGRWMNAIKVASGLLLLGFAHYLFFQAGASSQ